jgi:hypothetical protein
MEVVQKPKNEWVTSVKKNWKTALANGFGEIVQSSS